MSELVVKVPDELERDVLEMPEIKDEVREFIRLKVFEHELKKSKELQKFVVEALASKSKLSEKDAMVLGEKVNYGVLRELEEKKLV